MGCWDSWIVGKYNKQKHTNNKEDAKENRHHMMDLGSMQFKKDGFGWLIPFFFESWR